MLHSSQFSATNFSSAGTWFECHLRSPRLGKFRDISGLDEKQWVMRHREGMFIARLGGIDSMGEEVEAIFVEIQ